MADWRDNVETVIKHSRIKVPYTWSVGETGSKFLRALRDDKKLLANKCPTTGTIFCPPKKDSPTSLEPITEWLELTGDGEVLSYTQRHYETTAAEKGLPTIYALIKLDGADQAMPHLLSEVELSQVKKGMRVTPVFKEDRVGHILDIKYFKPV